MKPNYITILREEDSTYEESKKEVIPENLDHLPNWLQVAYYEDFKERMLKEGKNIGLNVRIENDSIKKEELYAMIKDLIVMTREMNTNVNILRLNGFNETINEQKIAKEVEMNKAREEALEMHKDIFSIMRQEVKELQGKMKRLRLMLGIVNDTF